MESVWHLSEIFFFRAPVVVRPAGLLRAIEADLQEWIAVHAEDVTHLDNAWTKVRVAAAHVLL